MFRLTGNVLEMSTVLQPGTTSGDVISCAFALDLDENGDIGGLLAIPLLEGLQELKTVGLGINLDLNGSAVCGRSLEGVLSRIVATGRELKARGRRELEGLARRGGDRVGQRVEGKGTSKGKSSDDIGRGDEGVSGGVSIVASSEVTVVRGDDYE